jgi:hypothetical protein
VPIALSEVTMTATRVIAIELKAEKGQLSLPQVSTQAELRAAGVRCHLARSIDDVERILEDEWVPIRAKIWGNGIRRPAGAHPIRAGVVRKLPA